MFNARIFSPFIFGLVFCIGMADAVSYRDENGMVVIEAESVPMDGDWKVASQLNDHTGDGYIVSSSKGTLKYTITFSTAGRWRFVWRTAAPHTTEHNDSYVRMTGPASVAILSAGGKACLTSGYAKIFSNGGGDKWVWQAKNCDHTSNPVDFELSQPGTYTFEIKYRSSKHKIDRIVFYDRSRVGDQAARSTTAVETLDDDSPLPPPGPEKVSLSAVDFDNKGDFYIDNHYLAVEPETGKAQASEPFPGKDAEYDITLFGVGEEDCESVYRVFIDGSVIGSFQVPETNEPMEEGSAFNYTWNGIQVHDGATIAVEGIAHSNKTIEENGAPGGYAWSRARWYRIEFVPSVSSGPGPVTRVAIIAPAAGTTLTMGSVITLKGEGTNLSWSYDANSDGKDQSSIGTGNELSFTIPTGISSPQELTLMVTGDGGTDQHTYALQEDAGTGTVRTLQSPRHAIPASRRGKWFTLDGRSIPAAHSSPKQTPAVIVHDKKLYGLTR